MIFATCGTSDMPFARMMNALTALPLDQLHVQHGPAIPPAGCAATYPFLEFGEMVSMIEQADHLVCHAGVGSIMCGLQAGHTPIVFPRLRRFPEETIDEHQRELATALAQRGVIRVAWDEGDLADALASVPARGTPRTLGSDELGAAVRAALEGKYRRGVRWGPLHLRRRQRTGSSIG